MHPATDLARRLLVPVGVGVLVATGTAVGVVLATAGGRPAATAGPRRPWPPGRVPRVG